MICPRPKPGNNIDPSHPSNPSEDMNVGKYSAHPCDDACGVEPDCPGKEVKLRFVAGELCIDSEGPAADGRILQRVVSGGARSPDYSHSLVREIDCHHVWNDNRGRNGVDGRSGI